MRAKFPLPLASLSRGFRGDSLTDFTTSAAICIVFVSMLSLVHVINFTPVQEFNCFPSYLYEYALRMFGPHILSFTIVALHYYRNGTMRAYIVREVKDQLRSISALEIS